MRQCWNRQTGTFEGRVRERMGSSPICRTNKTGHTKVCPVFLYNIKQNRKKERGIQ